MKLNDKNYYSIEANKEYMSFSQYKDFLSCESMAMAKLEGWKEPSNEAFIAGSYLHAWNEGCLDKFKKDHPELFKKNGELYEKYKTADEMIMALENDAFCKYVLQGQKEVIMTGEFAGCMWKIRIDTYAPEKNRLVDLKSVKSLSDKFWSKESRYVNFIEHYGYVGQMAIYSEIERQATGRESLIESYIVAVTKEDPPDKAIINFDEETLLWELECIRENMKRILSVKNGNKNPTRCGKCRYCRETKKIDKVIHYSELEV